MSWRELACLRVGAPGITLGDAEPWAVTRWGSWDCGAGQPGCAEKCDRSQPALLRKCARARASPCASAVYTNNTVYAEYLVSFAESGILVCQAEGAT